jgi:RND superfamily putative drug exporter
LTSSSYSRRYGIKTTAGVVTSAALVMVAVFSVFATLSTLFLSAEN